MTTPLTFSPYLPIEQHGLVGDRRTAALIAADSTINWLCLPDYDGASVFGALLDVERGGYWYLGPRRCMIGQQHYRDHTPMLVTTWTHADWQLELTDAMIWPEKQRPDQTDAQRVVVRRLRCLRGATTCDMHLYPRRDFKQDASINSTPGGLAFVVADWQLGLWSSFAVDADNTGSSATIQLAEGDACRAVFGLHVVPEEWSPARAQQAFDALVEYWNNWQRTLTYTGQREALVRRSAMLIHMLDHVPGGAVVAAPTTSLPERIGGDLNWDYRFAWVRDTSLALAIPSLLGNTEDVEHFLDWLSERGSATDAPLQVVYRIDGGTDLTEQQRADLSGYRSSQPVRIGNRAAGQSQPGSFGYLADCVLIYINNGGEWKEAHWDLIRCIADYVAANWQQPDSGIWELPDEAHYVSTKVMSWVTLDRAISIAEKTQHADETDHWRATRDAIHDQVMDQGWSEQIGAFRQRYGADTLDAATLLIPVMGFLPADHPRVQATVEQIAQTLTIDGLVYRFIAQDTPGRAPLPLGQFEGAFLPCTFWMIIAYWRMGRKAEAEALLQRVEVIAGELGLFAEEADPRNGAFLGNFPLLFSQAEYVRAILELDGKQRQ